jgi:hypothetical protein
LRILFGLSSAVPHLTFVYSAKPHDLEQLLTHTPMLLAAWLLLLLLLLLLLFQATLVLSLLPASCRSADPQLLPALRGELLYMARIIEQPVRLVNHFAVLLL